MLTDNSTSPHSSPSTPFGESSAYPELDLYRSFQSAQEQPSRVVEADPGDQVESNPAILGSGYRAEVAAALYRLGHAPAADKYLLCGKKTVAVLTCPADINHAAQLIFEHCDNRICSLCAPRLSARLVDRYAPAVENIIAAHPRRGYKLRHAVLTTSLHPLDEDAKSRYELIRDEVVTTLRDCICPRKPGESARSWLARWRAKKRTIGVIVVDEFGEVGNKLHFHVTFYGPFIPQAVLSQVWAAHTGYPIVYITNRQDRSVREVVQETLKYVTKFAVDGQATDPAVLAAIHDILAGRRRVRSWGLFYNIPPAPEEEPEHGACPECQQPLEVLQIGKFLERTNTYLKALQLDETTPDLSLEVLHVVASAASCSHIDIMFSARRQWIDDIWSGSVAPDPAEYSLINIDTNTRPHNADSPATPP